MTTVRLREGHLERTAHEPREKELLPVTLSRIDRINDRIKLFRLELQNGPVKFLAGQWLDTFVPSIVQAGGFTITSSPSAAAPSSTTSAPAYLELAVQESPLNAPAAWLWRSEKDILGSTLQVRIGGTFVFPPPGVALHDVRRVVFVAGGVGVNPLISMLSYLVEELEKGDAGRGSMDIVVLYASKMPESRMLSDVLFLDRMATLVERANKLRSQQVQARLILRITNTKAKEGLTLPPSCDAQTVDIHKGRLTSEELVTLVKQKDSAGSFVYICGPPDMTDEFTESLGDAGIDRHRVLTEKWW